MMGIIAMNVAVKHPLEPLTASEVGLAVAILKENGKVTPTMRFVSVSLKEPDKSQVHGFTGRGELSRQAHAVLGPGLSDNLFEPRVFQVPHVPVVALEAAFAAKQGLDAAPMVPKFASALAKAAKACPAVGGELGDNAARLKGNLKGGKLKMEAAGPDAPKAVACVAQNLDGAELGADETPLVIELRVAKKEATK